MKSFKELVGHIDLLFSIAYEQVFEYKFKGEGNISCNANNVLFKGNEDVYGAEVLFMIDSDFQIYFFRKGIALHFNQYDIYKKLYQLGFVDFKD